ncbi:MAG: GNAT family N-acetyltransferase [Anaerolineales bacterium]|nr:GNAT family N-acetyltransferase [Anaerolineales bacterium]
MTTAAGEAAGRLAAPEVGASRPAERAAILAVAQNTGVFTPEEVATVAELFDGYLAGSQQSGYNFLTARAVATGAVLGFACWGPTSLSRGAADLYWIAADPAAQGQGVAAALFRAVEDALRTAGRWLLVIWTSSRPEYAPARAFYLRMGAELAMQLNDFYDRGDDLCVFVCRW